MRQDVSVKSTAPAIYRGQATQRIFGPVTVIVPRMGRLALTVAVLALLLLGLAAWYVEIPQRARAVGVLMPPDGLLDVIAGIPGRITNIHVAEGQVVAGGDLLLDITSVTDRLAVDRLQVLRSEVSLLDKAHARELAIDRQRLQSLGEKLASVEQRLSVAREETALQNEQVRLLERRLARRRGLVDRGGIAIDAFEKEQGSLLQAKTRLAALHRAVLALQQDKTAMRGERNKIEDESVHREVMRDLERRRLEGKIVEHEHLVHGEIRASEAGVVARVHVRPGAIVRVGEALLKIYRPYRDLEAWLYLSSAKAGFLKQGQVVKLRFDAYPHQLFGTTDAIVTSVSSVAVVPGELKIPLALNGPVFEIRARLDKEAITAFGTAWVLKPGTSFRADIVQRRYRLYQWLLRGVAREADASGA